MKRWAAPLLGLTLSLPAPAEEPPPKQTIVFYNARIALRERRPTEALRLWLLRNSLADTGPRGVYDEEFRSVVWAALGALGLCQDAYPKDDERGAGLWPLALHNWVVKQANQLPPELPSPYDAFELGLQHRLISLHDTLSEAELRTVSFFPTYCSLPDVTLVSLGMSPSTDLTDRFNQGRMLRLLLLKSLDTLVRSKVQSVAAIEARIFDLDLAMAQLAARKARQAGQLAAAKARAVGISDPGAKEAKEAAMKWPEDSPQAAFLRRSLTWRSSEWLTMSRQRRQFLYSQARPFAANAAVVEPLVLDVTDALIARGEGAEVSAWIAALELGPSPSDRAIITAGDRGKRLLELEPESGFKDRSVIALHRGVGFLEAGSRQEALRSFAFAMAHAEESSEAAVILGLARRWLSFVLSRYETSEEVISMLKALVPRQEYNSVIEDLVWRAALRADARSFERIVASAQHGGAFDARAAHLSLLAHAKPGEMVTSLRDSAADEPYLTLRFTRQLLEKLEAEEADVRAANVPMLKLLIGVLDSIAERAKGFKAQATAAAELAARVHAILEGLSAFDTSPAARARALSPRHEAFAGNIRLAPVDTLPWPFRLPEAEAPSAFVPLVLKPIEWRGPDGKLVFGWKITE